MDTMEDLARMCGVLAGERAAVSFVGGGGKTTALFLLASFLCRRGIDAAVTTTTHFHIPAFADPHVPVYGTPENGKLAPPALFPVTHSILLAEADGAKGRPLKAPAAHEPVLLPGSTRVVAVAGLSAVGHTVTETGFRTEHICRLLGCGEDHRLTPEDLAHVLLSPEGGRKYAENLPFLLLLNQADTPREEAYGREIRDIADAGGVPSCIMCLHEERRRMR